MYVVAPLSNVVSFLSIVPIVLAVPCVLDTTNRLSFGDILTTLPKFSPAKLIGF